jgi:dihydroorotate dehydrogenase
MSRQDLLTPALRTRIWDLDFRSVVGLAAGFDKNGRLLRALPHLGFGFAEIGSVTPLPQSGNTRPRLARNPAEQAIWNAMGFNNDGVEAVARRLEHARHSGWIPVDFPVGVNLGKNKDTSNEEAFRDYLAGASRFLGLADYLVVNVSSPNTAGLRALQQPSELIKILEPVLSVRASKAPRTPVLLKLAPEIAGEALAELIHALDPLLDGWIFTNTLQASPGGISGGPLALLSRERTFQAIALTRKPIVSCGGILTPDEARVRVNGGARLVQTYSGYVYGGPEFPVRCGLIATSERGASS